MFKWRFKEVGGKYGQRQDKKAPAFAEALVDLFCARI